MTDTLNPMDTRAAERLFLRRFWWGFPLAGWVASLAWGGAFWRWVEGANPLPLDGVALAGPLNWLCALGFLLIPAVWRLLLPVRLPRGAALIGALIAVSLAEGLLRTATLQAPLWLASRSRLEPDQHFMREVCYVRLEETDGRWNSAPGLVLVGSSQVLCGVDEHLLRDLVRPVPVIRRAVFGLTPLKALSMATYVPYRPGDVCVQYLSEMDFTDQDVFPHSWFRPFASWRTWRLVMTSISFPDRLRHWRRAVDYALGATSETWRARDFIRQIALHFRGARADASVLTGAPDLPALVDNARAELHFMPGEQRAFLTYAGWLQQQGVDLLVFEGDVSPALHSASRLRAKQKVRQKFADMAAQGILRYVPMTEQGLNLTADHWGDYTHLNETGRERLTRRIAMEWSPP
jgi:hypothetical protein